MKKGKPFYFRLEPLQLLTALIQIPETERGIWITQVAVELSTGEAKSEFAQSLFAEAKRYQEEASERSRIAGLASAEKRQRTSTDVEQTLTDVEQTSTEGQPKPTQKQLTEAEAETETEAKKKRAGADSGKPSRPSPAKMSDEEWLAEIKGNQAYQGIDVDALKGKMEAWCMTKGKKPTRARLLNWLNREEKPLFLTNQPVIQASKGAAGALARMEALMRSQGNESQ